MRAALIFKDEKIAVVNDLIHVNKLSLANSSVTKIEKYDDFVIHGTPYAFVGKNTTLVVNGSDLLYVTFDSQQ